MAVANSFAMMGPAALENQPLLKCIPPVSLCGNVLEEAAFGTLCNTDFPASDQPNDNNFKELYFTSVAIQIRWKN